MNWVWKKFSELSVDELYQSIQLRERVFVLEQNCPYLDCDGLDPVAWHLLGYQDNDLVAYLRVFAPGIKYKDASFGRVVSSPTVRGTGCGRALTAEGLRRMQELFGDVPVRISAQAYLQKFYGSFGFQVVSEPYLEDNIPHVEMLLSPSV